MQMRIKRRKITKPYLIGITGGLGTGKSLVGKVLKHLGICVIDTDEIVKSLLSYKNKITKKIVSDFDEGLRRIYEYSLPLESERARKAYGVPGSSVNKLLIINKEYTPNRITMIIIKENLGF